MKDQFLREESRGEGHGDERGKSKEEGDTGERHFFQQSAHFPDVLFVVAGVDDRARAKEEQGLEPCVGEEVEHARFAGNEADRHDHVAELRERRVGQHAFDVILLHGHQCGDQCGDATGPCDDGAGLQSFEDFEAERKLQAEEHVDAGGDHRRGVDECRHRSGAFHRIGQPDMEWQLGRFADRAAEDAEDRGREHTGGNFRRDFHFIECQRAGDAPEHQDADHESEVTHAIAEEGLLRGIGGGVLVVPVTDQQVGAEADQLPEDEGHDEIRRQHDAGHRKHEERESGEVAVFRRVVLHVGERENVNERADAGDDRHHAGRELVELDADLQVKVTDGGPVEVKGAGLAEQAQ